MFVSRDDTLHKDTSIGYKVILFLPMGNFILILLIGGILCTGLIVILNLVSSEANLLSKAATYSISIGPVDSMVEAFTFILGSMISAIL